MKLRFSFSLKILLPYLLIASLFIVIFFRVRNNGDLMLTLVAASGILVSIMLGVVHNFWLRKPLYRVGSLVTQLTRGKLPVFGNSKSTDEIGEALLSLKGSLMASRKESESRRHDEENRTWAAHGMAKFSKLFREAEDDLQDLARELMKELVAYTEADVGALFIATETREQPVLQLTGSYAFDREKVIHQSFEFGEGLVGRAAMEKDLIYITDLPPGYMKIRSGLGEDVPYSLLLVPVILDSNVLGVIELASLGEIPAFQAGFIQQLADALATTIAKVKANQKNRELLEQSRKQAEALASQELVFRQNLEKLEKAAQAHLIKEEKLEKEIERLKKMPI